MTRTPPQALGRISHWDAAKGLGFVEPHGGGDRLLLKKADLAGRLKAVGPVVGQAVRYNLRVDGTQRRAIDVTSVTPPNAVKQPPKGPTTSSSRLMVIPAFAVVLGALHLAWPLPRVVPLLYGALSTALFIIYGLDKWAARKGQARVAEASLHLVALLGGWPGALLGQQLFRHKTAKPAFLRMTWAMVCLNVLLLIALANPAWHRWF
jgi:uncharacterized membrane protein YsdA (DUF1294 family)/cold shock CspA family protein